MNDNYWAIIIQLFPSMMNNSVVTSNKPCITANISADVVDCLKNDEDRSSVSFGYVQVREFERIVGDHPCVSDHGPPLSIGWGYHDDGVETPVESFVMTHGPYPYKRDKFLPLGGEDRRIILQKFFNVSGKAIREATKQVAQIKKQRSETIEIHDKKRIKKQRSELPVEHHHGKIVEKVQIAFGSTMRCIKRRSSYLFTRRSVKRY